MEKLLGLMLKHPRRHKTPLAVRCVWCDCSAGLIRVLAVTNALTAPWECGTAWEMGHSTFRSPPVSSLKALHKGAPDRERSSPHSYTLGLSPLPPQKCQGP